jgi:hypothetical protein
VDVVRSRLKNQCIEPHDLARPVDAVRWLVASQAQDFALAKWAVALRTHDAGDADLERDLDDGEILRTHLLRPTWHFVAREDIRWLLALTAPRVGMANQSIYRKEGLDPGTRAKALDVVAHALEDGRPRTRDELRDALAQAGITAAGHRLAYILMAAELEALLCSGPRHGKQHTYALLDHRAPAARALAREEALVALAVRYIASRGPATVHDFAKWSGLTIADARTAFEGTTAQHADVDGAVSWWTTAEERPRSAVSAHLLSIYDEYISSYRDRSALGDRADAQRLLAMGNALTAVLIVNGRIAGTWKREVAKATVHVAVAPFRALGDEEHGAVVQAAERYARFVGSDRTLTVEVG